MKPDPDYTILVIGLLIIIASAVCAAFNHRHPDDDDN